MTFNLLRDTVPRPMRQVDANVPMLENEIAGCWPTSGYYLANPLILCTSGRPTALCLPEEVEGEPSNHHSH